jgi:hypothetical protein
MADESVLRSRALIVHVSDGGLPYHPGPNSGRGKRPYFRVRFSLNLCAIPRVPGYVEEDDPVREVPPSAPGAR